jgi:uncharacterized phage infection (PIP) family protein YhgE
MAQLDDSIENLKTLIGRLQAGKSKTQETVGAVNEQAGELATLATSATQAIGEFISAVDHFSSDLHSSEGEASGQLDKVAEEAHRTAAERLGELARQLEEDDFQNTVQVFRDDLDKDSTGMVTNGIQVMLTAVQHLQGEVDTARGDAEAAFQALDGGVQGIGGQSETAFHAGADQMEASLADFGNESTQLETQATDVETQLKGRASELQTACSDTGDAATSAYDGHVATIDAAAQDLVLSVHTMIEDTAGYVTTCSQDQIDAPVGLVTGDAIPPLMDELGEVDQMIRDADHTTSETESLCSELDRCQHVVAEIDQILDAMNAG